jgi:hypothetical protein
MFVHNNFTLSGQSVYIVCITHQDSYRILEIQIYSFLFIFYFF